MRKNTLISAIMFLFYCSLSAQQLYSENFENFTLGNVSTASDGQTAGQGSWYVYSHWTYQNGTPYEYLFQIENTTTNGKVISMAPHPYPYLISGTSINKDLNTAIANRTLGNNVIKLEVDFYTGQQANSLDNTVNFGLNRNMINFASNIVAGFTFDSVTGELKGIHYDKTTTPLPTIYQSNLNDNNKPLIVPFNTWIRCVVYADYINNKVVYEIPSLGIIVKNDFFVNIPYPTNITNHVPQSFSAWTSFVDATNSGLPTYKFDNLKVTALNQVLSTKEVLANRFNLYPNPATDLVTITNQENITVKQIKIYDLAGKLTDTQNFESKAVIQLNVEKLTQGTYLLHLQTNEGTAVKKLIKK